MIYFMQPSMGGPVKIGTSRYLYQRAYQIQIAVPFRMVVVGAMDGDRDEEQRLHAVFDDDKLVGEWFRPSPAISKFVQSIGGKLLPSRAWDESDIPSPMKLGQDDPWPGGVKLKAYLDRTGERIGAFCKRANVGTSLVSRMQKNGLNYMSRRSAELIEGATFGEVKASDWPMNPIEQ